MSKFKRTTSPEIKPSDLSKSFGISPQVIYNRRQKGWPWNCILLTPMRGQYTELNSSEELKMQYKEHKALCQKFGASMNPDDVYGSGKETALSYHALAKGFGIPSTTLITRVREGWSWKKSLTTRSTK